MLLILAGITFNSLVGSNGLLNKASAAGEKSRQAANNEEIGLQELDNEIAKWTSGVGSSGNTEEIVHVHSYGNWLSLDTTSHSKSCACGASQEEEHSLVITFPTWNAAGHPAYCTECDFTGIDPHDTKRNPNLRDLCVNATTCNSFDRSTLFFLWFHPVLCLWWVATGYFVVFMSLMCLL